MRRLMLVPVLAIALGLSACAGSAGPIATGRLTTAGPSASASPSPAQAQKPTYTSSEWLPYFPLSRVGERCTSSFDDSYRGYLFTFSRIMSTTKAKPDGYCLLTSTSVTETLSLRGSGHTVTTGRWTARYGVENDHTLLVPLVLGGGVYPGEEYSWSSGIQLPPVGDVIAGSSLESDLTLTLDTDRTAGATQLTRAFGTSKPKFHLVIEATGLKVPTTLHAGGHTFHDVIAVKVVITSMKPTRPMRNAHAGAALMKSLNQPQRLYFARGKGEVMEQGGEIGHGHSLVWQSCKGGKTPSSSGDQSVAYVTRPA